MRNGSIDVSGRRTEGRECRSFPTMPEADDDGDDDQWTVEVDSDEDRSIRMGR